MDDKNELERKQTEATAIRKDIKKARDIISRALIQYTKNQIKAKNRQQVADQEAFLEDRFKDLEPYNTTRDIQDAYGYADISIEEYDRLMDLWKLREEAKKNDGKYRDRVTDMLEVAIRRIGSEYDEQLTEIDDLQHQHNKKMEEARRYQEEKNWVKKKVKI